jgi:hypothetical protein
MKSRLILLVALMLATSLLASSGCALASDFDKATPIGVIDLEKDASLRRELTVPAGRGRLMIAVANYRCAPFEATIQIGILGAEGAVLSRRVSLSQLTWSYGRDSCDAIGYLEQPDSKGSRSATDDAEMRLRFGAGKSRYTIEAMTIDSNSTNKRSAELWLIYGDRVPTARIFGTAKK